MTAARTLARAGIIVSALFLASRALGWVRVIVLGNAFEAPELGLFFAAFRVPDLMFQLVAAGALSSALIPIVAGLVATGEDARAWRVVSTVANLVVGALLVLAVVLAVAAPAVVPLITPGFDVVQTARTVELTRIMLLSPIFLALGAVATSVLNARQSFSAAALAPIVYNVAIIGGALLLAPIFGIEGLAVGVVVGALGHLLVQLRPLLGIGFRYEPVVATGDPQARRALVLMAPRAIGLGAGQITFVVVTALATLHGAAAVTAYTIAFALLQIPVGVIGVPLGVVVFPALSHEVALGRVGEYVSMLTRALRLLTFTMVPIAGLVAILRRQTVAILFPTYDAATVGLIANTLLFFLVGLAAHALIAVLARAFYARQDTLTPVLAALGAVALNVTAAIVLNGLFGLGGIALAIALGAWFEAVVLLAVLRRRIPAFEVGTVVRVLLESALATVVAGAVALGVLYLIDSLIGPEPGLVALVAQSTVVTAAFGSVFVGMALALRIPELPSIVGLMTDLARRRS